MCYLARWPQFVWDIFYWSYCAIHSSNLKNSLPHAMCEQEQVKSLLWENLMFFLRLQHFISPRERAQEYLKLHFYFHVAGSVCYQTAKAYLWKQGIAGP